MSVSNPTQQRPTQSPAVSQPALAAPPFVGPKGAASVFCFAIQADADPGVLPRVLELFAKRGLVPRRWISDRVGPGGRELAIDLQVEALTQPIADHIARCLRQVPCVSLVLMSEKLSAEKFSR